jgi:hypothetical protein
MRFLLTITMICAFFGVSYSQTKDTLHNVGKDRDGDTWYLDTEVVRRLDPPAEWAYIMPIYTKLSGRTLVFFFNVDCTDNTYQLVRSLTLDSNARVINRTNERSVWAPFTGYSGNAARIVCRENQRLPITNRGVVSE